MPRASVDEQVVKMSFDNSKFDSNINESIKTLNALDQKLAIFGNKDNFNQLTVGINKLASTLTIKGQIMLGVFTSLGNEIVKFGIKAKNALFKGIKDGLGEYNQIIESTQTIYQNVKQSGASIGDVNNALDELNDYADKTIYNFGQMTRMIGMFTSAGVGLKKSVSTIKGLSNAAALVGANMQKAQIGWNAVSRAMSSGRFTNMTWRSLELSGIAGKQFNKVITEVARNMHVKGQKTGKDIDGMIKKYGSLRESLKEGWLNKKVFTEAMDIMSGAMTRADMKKRGYTDKQIRELRKIAEAAEEAATKVKTFKQLMETTAEAIGSGWAQSFRILIGDLEQAKKLYSRISNVISNFIDNNANIRNELFHKIVEGGDSFDRVARDFTTGQVKEVLKGWETGRENFTQIIENMLAVVKTFLKSVKTGFLNIFPVDRIAAAARKVLSIVQQFTRALVINKEELDADDNVLGWDTKNIDEISDAIKDLIKFFRGLAAAVDIAWMAISQPMQEIILRIPFLTNFFESINKGIRNFTNRLGKFGDRITVVRDAAKEFNIFGLAAEYVFDNFDKFVKKSPVLNSVVKIFNALKSAIIGTKNALSNLDIKPIAVLFGIFKMAVISLWNALNAVIGLISDVSSNIDWSWLEAPKEFILNILKIFSDYGRGLITFKEAMSKIGEAFGPIFTNIFEVISKIPFSKIFGGIFNTLSNAFSSIVKIVKTFFGNNGEVIESTEAVVKTFGDINADLGKANGLVTNLSNSVNKVSNGAKILLQPVKQIKTSIKDANTETMKSGTILKRILSVFGNFDKVFENASKKILLIGSGLGLGAIGISHLIKKIEKIKILSNVNNLLDAGVDVIKAYQKQIQSKSILNIAIAIGILASAMLTLAFIPYDKLENGLSIFVGFMATIALTVTPVIEAMAKLSSTFKQKLPMNQYEAMTNVLNNLINSTKQFAMKMAKGMNARLIGKAFKDIAISVLILAGAMVVLKVAFKNPNDIIMPIKVIIGMLVAMTAVVGILTGVIESFNKSLKDVRPSVGIFSTFFKLTGVSKIIIALSVSMLALVGALVVLSKIDTTQLIVSATALLVIFGALGGLSVLLTSIAKNATNSKVKVVTGSIAAVLLAVGAIALALGQIEDPLNLALVIVGIGGVFAAFAGLMKAIGSVKVPDNISRLNGVIATITGSIIAITISVGALIAVISKTEDVNAWWQSLTTLGTMFMLFGATTVTLLEVGKRIGNSPVWTKLQTTIAIVSGSMLTIAASLALIGKVPPIPASVIAILGIMALVIESVMAVAIVMTSVRGGLLSESFIRTIMFVSIAISAIAVSIGATAAAIAAMVSSISKISVSSSDMGKLSQDIIDKIAYVGTLIITSIPSLADLFAKIGYAVGTVFASFLRSFVDRIAAMSEEYNEIADKIVNLILDLASKVVDSLYNRKDEIANIVMKTIAVIYSVVKTIIDNIFKKGGAGTGNEEFDWSKIGMIIAKVVGAISAVLVIAKVLPIIYSIVKKITKLIYNVLAPLCRIVIAENTAGISGLIFDFAALAVAIAATTAVIIGAYHAYRQLRGEEEAYHNASIQTLDDVGANLTNLSFMIQVLAYGTVTFGRLLKSAFDTLVNGFKIVGASIVYALTKPLEFVVQLITESLAKIVGLFSPDLAKKIRNFSYDFFSAFSVADKMESAISDSANGIEEAFNSITDYEIGNNSWVIGEKNGQNLVNGTVAGLSDYGNAINNVLSQGDFEAQNGIRLRWDMHSPSKVMEELYRNIGLGGKVGLESSMETLYDYVQDANGELVGEMASGVAKQKYAIEQGTKTLKEATEKSLETGSLYGEYFDKDKEDFKREFDEALAYKEEVIVNGKKKLTKSVAESSQLKTQGIMGESSKAADPNKAYKSDKVSEMHVNVKQNTADIASYINALKTSIVNDNNAITQSIGTTLAQEAVVIERATELRNTRMQVYDVNTDAYKQIELDTRIVDIIEQQKAALVGKSKAEAAVYLAEIAQERGIENAKEASYLAVNALWSQQMGMEKLALKSVNKVVDATHVSLDQYVGATGAANALVLKNYLDADNEMLKLAYEHADELIGLNKKQAQQKLYDEARARGMSEEDAKVHSESLVKMMFAQKNSQKTLNKDAILSGIKMGEVEENKYKERLEHETYELQKALDKRMAAKEYAEKMMAEGKFDTSSYRNYMEKVYGDLDKAYKKQVDKYNSTVKSIEKELEKKGKISEKTWKKQFDEAINTLNKQKSKKRGTFLGALDEFKKTVKNGVAGALDLNSWANNFKTGDGGNLKDKDKDVDPVKEAKKTKDKLEKERADLTPTFDLDRLSDEAKKANGIVMSSLMAAQNASIADYINTDSELNPFMKDRWQNVYNFTQNNYSPKALSRIDIYRQTQRQISMSRGF